MFRIEPLGAQRGAGGWEKPHRYGISSVDRSSFSTIRPILSDHAYNVFSIVDKILGIDRLPIYTFRRETFNM